MVRTRSDHIVLWPTYFDSRKSKAEGRRVSKKASIEKPTVEEIFKATKSLDLEVTIQGDKSHPNSWWEKEGMLRVEKTMSKTQLITKVAAKLKETEHTRVLK
jgi:signal recognition particle subunit SRP19